MGEILSCRHILQLWLIALTICDTFAFLPNLQQRKLILNRHSSAAGDDVSLNVATSEFSKEDSAAVPDRDDHIRILDENLKRCSGLGLYDRILGEDAEHSPSKIHDNERWVVVSHDTAEDTPASVVRGEGPVFNYGNLACLKQFRMQWDEFTCLPSRYSAEEMERGARERLLAKVRKYGYADDSNIVRVAKDGTRFQIEKYILWNLFNDDGNYYGQACIFDRNKCRPPDS